MVGRLPAIYRAQQLIFTLHGDGEGPLVVISPPTTMVQSMIHSDYTTVHDGRNIVANEVDLFLIYCLVICVAVCHACDADFCRVVVGMTVTPASHMWDMAKQAKVATIVGNIDFCIYFRLFLLQA